jgi:hypothetical protein
MTTTQRPLTPNEREQLAGWLAGAQRSFGLRGFLTGGALPTFTILALLWLVVVELLAKTATGAALEANLPLRTIGVALVAVYAFWEQRRAGRGLQDPRQPLRDDLAGGVAEEVTLQLTAAKRYQEPEHGGLVYCFRTSDETVFVLFDYGSQQLGVEDEDPLTSDFQPREVLHLVRTPRSGLCLSTRFAGAPLPLPAPRQLTLPPEKWPESETFTDIPWEDLDKRLSGGV